LRNQLHLRGKMHYWRTVMLQFGFNSQVAQHQLPTWLAGYVVPETVRTLLNPEEENSSVTFQQFWAALGKAALNSTTTEVEFQLIHSPWCPEESRTLFLASLQQTRLSKPASSSGRIEDEDRNPTLFGLPRLGDSEFTLPLSRNLPKELTTADAQRLTLSMQGLPLTFIVGDAEGHLVFDGGPLRVSIRDVLKQPEREVKIILPHVGLYKERFAFWDDSEDVILFAGTQGRRVLDKSEMQKNPRRICSLIVRADLQVRSGSDILSYELCSESWALYRFPEGLTKQIAVFAGEQLLWVPENDSSDERQFVAHGRLVAEELSPSRLSVRVELEDGWACQWFRFGGQKYNGAFANISVAPNYRYRRASALIEARRGIERTFMTLVAEPAGPAVPGAAYQSEDGQWHDLYAARPLDSGALEGRALACRWQSSAEQEAWLMLGDQPLFAEPDLVRRQQIPCCGEPLYIRFGLMHEDRTSRITLASAVYATGFLAGIEFDQSSFLLRLRGCIQRANEFRVWVWERDRTTPRCLDPLEVQLIDETTLYVLGESVAEPLGWLLSWQGMWRGARFQGEPRTSAWQSVAEGWCHILDHTQDWIATAKALRAWRFPVLMQPFCGCVRRRTAQHPISTADAWTRTGPLLEDLCGAHIDGSLFDYVAPLRDLLFSFRPTNTVVQDFLEKHAAAVLAMDWQNNFYEPAASLLRAQPVLLAQLLVTYVKEEFTRREELVNFIPVNNFFHKERDPKQIADLRKSTELVVKVMVYRLHSFAGVPPPSTRPDDLSSLQEAALNDLRSWVDSSPVDSMFFTSCITEPAELLFRGEQAEVKWLRLAIARSAVCCAFLAAHLICNHLYRELKDGSL
jgi:hypothetical protein